jgi:hypothetical protein
MRLRTSFNVVVQQVLLRRRGRRALPSLLVPPLPGHGGYGCWAIAFSGARGSAASWDRGSPEERQPDLVELAAFEEGEGPVPWGG